MSMTEVVNSIVHRYNKLNDYCNFASRVLSDFSRYRRRKELAKGGFVSSGSVSIKHQDGYVLTTANQIEGLENVVPTLQAYADCKLASLNVPYLLEHGTGKGGRPVKPFYFNILTRQDLLAMPQLVDFALSDGILNVLVPYYGLLPELSHMAVFASGFAEPFTPDSKPLGTQCLHTDNHDLKHVKLFCFLADVGEEDGPLTLLPAEKSAWLLRKTGRRWRTAPFRDDKEFLRYFGEKDLVRVTGPAGTVAIVDTSNCLHYGSRCHKNGRRTAFVIHYTLFNAYTYRYSADYEDLNMATSPEFRARVADDERRALVYHLLSTKN